MAGPYSGQPKSLVMTNAPIIEITESDCDNSLIPDTVEYGEQQLPKADEDHKRFWRNTIATNLMHEGKFWPGLRLRPEMTFRMPRFPAGYELYVSTRDDYRYDYYLYGFKEDGTHWTFTSPADFVMHAKWLAFGRPSGACGCQYCSSAYQNDIGKKLKACTKKVKMPSRPRTILKGSKKRKAAVGVQPRPEKHRKLDKVGINVKDYTGGKTSVSKLHQLQLAKDKIDRAIEEQRKQSRSETALSEDETPD